jgi:WD40 repeat protein
MLLTHAAGVTSVSCAPSNINLPLSFVSSGIDGLLKVWTTSLNKNNSGYDINSFTIRSVMEGHEDVITQVAWKPVTDNYSVIASTGVVKYLYNY